MLRIFNCLLFFFTIILITSCSHTYDQTFEFEPSSISPGDEITIYYVTKNTPLADSDSLELAAYFYNNELLETTGFVMMKDDSGYYCKIKTNPDADGLIVKFNDLKSDKYDNNNNEGYLIPIKELRADAGYAVALSSWGYYLEMDNNREKAFDILDNILNRSPELLADFGDNYFNTVWRIKAGARDSIVSEKLAKLEELRNTDESSLKTLVNWYKNLEKS